MLAACWVIAINAAVLTAVALALPTRITFNIVATIVGAAAIRSTFLLAGRRAVRALAWDGGRLTAFLGRSRNEARVTLAMGSFHLGRLGMLLRLNAAEGLVVVFIDSGKQDAGDLRRLIRWLNSASGDR